MSLPWFQGCQAWLSLVEAFAADTDERRRVSRYVVWCHALALDPDERNSDRVEAFLRDARQIRNSLPFNDQQKRQYRDAIEAWHNWRETPRSDT